jgi:hypothetical protein
MPQPRKLKILQSEPIVNVVPAEESEVPQTELKSDLVLKMVRSRSLLQNFGIPTKVFALELGVSERFIRFLITGEKPIPLAMCLSIIKVGEDMLLKQKDLIDDYIEQAMRGQYGR